MFSSLKRIYEITRIIIYYRLDRALPDSGALRYVKWLAYLHPAHYRRIDENLNFGARLRLALEHLGPIFVKLGQTLSTRPDLIPPEIAVELNKLQDKVPPFPGDIARQTIEAALREPISAVFAKFDDQALASASVAQVHSATLLTGEAVVVKVLRPNVQIAVKRDIKLMYTLAHLVGKTKEGGRLRPVEVVKEFQQTMDDELDLTNEAASASQVRVNFKDSKILHVPKVYWPYCRKHVMVQERIFYPNITEVTNVDGLVNKKVLAERGVEIFFTQVFRDSFFHADMHPGNIFVDVEDPENPKYCAIDFGIMGALTPEDQHYLAENFLAFFNRDYRRVAELHVESGWVPATTRVTDFESAIRKVSEPIFGKPIKDISFGAFLFSLFQTARRFDMKIQPQLVLLQKTFFNVEGLGRRLYPELDLWQTAKPVLEQWMKDQIGPKAIMKQMRTNAHEYAQKMPKMPLMAYRVLERELENPPQARRRQTTNTRHLASALLILVPLALWIIYNPESLWQKVALGVVALFGFWHWIRKTHD